MIGNNDDDEFDFVEEEEDTSQIPQQSNDNISKEEIDLKVNNNASLTKEEVYSDGEAKECNLLSSKEKQDSFINNNETQKPQEDKDSTENQENNDDIIEHDNHIKEEKNIEETNQINNISLIIEEPTMKLQQENIANNDIKEKDKENSSKMKDEKEEKVVMKKQIINEEEIMKENDGNKIEDHDDFDFVDEAKDNSNSTQKNKNNLLNQNNEQVNVEKENPNKEEKEEIKDLDMNQSEFTIKNDDNLHICNNVDKITDNNKQIEQQNDEEINISKSNPQNESKTVGKDEENNNNEDDDFDFVEEEEDQFKEKQQENDRSKAKDNNEDKSKEEDQQKQEEITKERSPKIGITAKELKLEIKENNDDDFNFVNEENDESQKKSEENQTSIKQQSKCKDNSDSDDSIESQEDNLPRLKEAKNDQNQSKKLTQIKKEEIKPTSNEEDDDDVFDFVDEENNTEEKPQAKNQESKENKQDESNDDFDFVDEDNDNNTTFQIEKETSKSTEKQSKPQISLQTKVTTTVNPISFAKNAEKIHQLLNNYKTKHNIKKINQVVQQSSNYKNTSHISDFSLNKITKTYSIKSLIESVSKFKQSSLIEIKPFLYNQLYLSSKSQKPTMQNIYNQSNDFIANVNNQTKEFYSNLNIKYHELTKVYKTTNDTNVEEIEDEKISESIQAQVIRAMEGTQSTLNIIENNTKNNDNTFLYPSPSPSTPVAKVDNKNSSPFDYAIKQPSPSKQQSKDKTIKKEHPKIEINSDLFSAFSGIDMSKPSTTITTTPIKQHEEPIEQKFDEDHMMKMLMSLGVKKEALIKKPEIEEKTKDQIDKEKNEQKLREFIDQLPNYGFLTSKFVEYPDSLFNI